MPNGRIKKYRVEYIIKNTTGNRYAPDVNLNAVNWKISIKPTIYGTNSYDPSEKVSWSRIADMLIADPIIGGAVNGRCDEIINPKNTSIISYKGKKFRTKKWFVLVDNHIISVYDDKIIKSIPWMGESLPVDEYTVQSFDNFSLEEGIRMTSSFNDLIYLLKRTKMLWTYGE